MPLACKTISDECAAFKAIGWLLLYRVWHNDPSSKLLNRKLTFVSDSIHCMLSQVVRIFSNRPKLGLEACAHAISRNLYHHVSACVNLQISVRCFKYQSSQPSMMSDHFQHCLGYHPAGADQLTPLACGHGIIAFGLMQSIGCAWVAIYRRQHIHHFTCEALYVFMGAALTMPRSLFCGCLHLLKSLLMQMAHCHTRVARYSWDVMHISINKQIYIYIFVYIYICIYMYIYICIYRYTCNFLWIHGSLVMHEYVLHQHAFLIYSTLIHELQIMDVAGNPSISSLQKRARAFARAVPVQAGVAILLYLLHPQDLAIAADGSVGEPRLLRSTNV